MKKTTLGYNVNAVRLGEIQNKQLKKQNEITSKICKNDREKQIMDEGERLGYLGSLIPEEYKNSKYFGVFENGYKRGQRKRYIENLEKNKQKNIQIIHDMLENNIPLEEAPEEIKNNPSLVAYYKLCQHKAGKGKRR